MLEEEWCAIPVCITPRTLKEEEVMLTDRKKKDNGAFSDEEISDITVGCAGATYLALGAVIVVLVVMADSATAVARGLTYGLYLAVMVFLMSKPSVWYENSRVGKWIKKKLEGSRSDHKTR